MQKLTTNTNIKQLSNDETCLVQGAASIPTEERIRPFTPRPIAPKKPIFVTMAINEDGGHWKSI